ncbi:hypothetical protein CR513_42341, partial [Mucuna pruriens]
MPKRDDTRRLKGVINTIVGRFIGNSSSSTKNDTCALSTISTLASTEPVNSCPPLPSPTKILSDPTPTRMI